MLSPVGARRRRRCWSSASTSGLSNCFARSPAKVNKSMRPLIFFIFFVVIQFQSSGYLHLSDFVLLALDHEEERHEHPMLGRPTDENIKFPATDAKPQSTDRWTHDNTSKVTTEQMMLNSTLRCYVPRNHLLSEQQHQMCECQNCCIDRDSRSIHSFDSTSSSIKGKDHLKSLNVTGSVFQMSWYIPVHVDGSSRSDERLRKEDFIGVPWISTPTHATANVDDLHPLVLWFWQADIWNTWRNHSWIATEQQSSVATQFHWVLFQENDIYKSTDWYATTHPDSELPVFVNRFQHDKICFEKLMIGHEHATEASLDKSSSWYGSFNIWAMRFLRNKKASQLLADYVDYYVYRSGLSQIQPNPQTALYLSRSDSTKRRIINQDEVIRIVEEEGFNVTTVVLTGMGKEETHKLMRTASLVFGPHGAGFANTLVCAKGTTILETHPWGFQKYGYAFISKTLGFHYLYWNAPDESYTNHTAESLEIHTKSKAHRSTSDKKNLFRHRDMWVDTVAFRKLVKKAAVNAKT